MVTALPLNANGPTVPVIDGGVVFNPNKVTTINVAAIGARTANNYASSD
jgi:hypothetical protein